MRSGAFLPGRWIGAFEGTFYSRERNNIHGYRQLVFCCEVLGPSPQPEAQPYRLVAGDSMKNIKETQVINWRKEHAVDVGLHHGP